MLTRKQIVDKLRDFPPFDTGTLELVKSDGYFYFIFDSPERNIFETHSVFVNNVNQLSLDQWLFEGLHFAERLSKNFANTLYN